MKTFILVLATIFANAAFAGEYSSYQRINFQSASTFVPANNVCQYNGYLYHTKKDSVAVKYCDGEKEGHGNCTTVYKKLEQPMKSTAKRCKSFYGTDDKYCAAWETYALNQGPTVKVITYVDEKAYEDADGSGIGPDVVSVTHYTLPTCSK